MTLTPAYGRDYTSVKKVKADWEANKDFVIADVFHPDSGRYVNKQDLPAGTSVNVRYAAMRKVCVLKV